ncbi:hypothetical protein [Saccharopolyspora montiporae]|uniref:hypothetical protein n=1 Tax=Saccharopolyspora montiporae TaxID=2781240 RepID=UPI00351C1486
MIRGVRTGSVPGFLRRHWLLVLLLVAGLALRVVVQLAYRPALLYIDSFRYLADLGVFYPGGINPIGYGAFLLPLLTIGDLAFVAAVQHLLGLGLGVWIYALLRRHGAPNWLAALAAAPVLLDAYQLQIEHNIMSDLLFQAVLLGAVHLLTRARPGPRTAALAGVLLGCAVLVRLVGVTLVLPAAVFVLLAAGCRPADGWRRRIRSAGALVAGFAVLLGGYAVYNLAWTGVPALSGSTGSVVYGRTAVVADCPALDLTPAEELVCPDEPVAQRELTGIDHYIHFYAVQHRVAEELPEGTDLGSVQGSFARKVLLHQPDDVLAGVLTDFLKGFAPTRTQAPGDVPLHRWQFQTEYPLHAEQWYVAEWAELHDGGTVHADPELAGFLRAYQLGGGYTPGTLLGLAFVPAALAVLGVGRARRSGLRAICLLPAGLAVAVLGTAAAMEFSWRYQLPGLVLLPVAAALGLTALFGPRTGNER